MEKTLLLVFLIFITGRGYSQTFERIIPTGFDTYGQDVVFFQNHFYVLSTSVTGPELHNYSSTIYKMDMGGELVDSLKFDFLNKHVLLNRLLLLDNHIFSYGYTNELDTEEIQAIHLKLDTNLGLKFIHVTGTDSLSEYFRDMMVTEDGRLIAIYMGGYPYYLIEINSLNGSIEFKRAVYNPDYMLMEIPAYYLLHCWTRGFGSELLSFDSDSYALIDSVNSPSYIDKRRQSILIDDSSYFISAHYMKADQVNQVVTWDFALLKVHKDLYYMDSITFSTPVSQNHHTAFYKALDYQHNTSRLFYGGTDNKSYYPPSTFIPAKHRFQLLNIERNGSLNRRMVFGGEGDYADVMFSLAATPDGGCIMVGSRWNYGEQPDLNKRDIYILKVDSLGNYVPSVGIEKKEVNVPRNINLYPNPNNGSFTLSIASESNLFPTNIFVYDALGNKVYQALDVKSQNMDIDISRHSKGIYLVRVQKGNEQFLKKVVKQ